MSLSRPGITFTAEQRAMIEALPAGVVPRPNATDDRLEAALYDLVTATLRAHRSRAPETTSELVVASARVESITAALIPKIHALIAQAIIDLNTEGAADDL
jgi:hypothetical protein